MLTHLRRLLAAAQETHARTKEHCAELVNKDSSATLLARNLLRLQPLCTLRSYVSHVQIFICVCTYVCLYVRSHLRAFVSPPLV